MLVAGAGEDYLLILAVVASDMHQYTSRITVGAVHVLKRVNLLHCLSLMGAETASGDQDAIHVV